MATSLVERVKMLMARLNIGNATRFAKELGLKQPTLEKKIRGVQKFNVTELQRILEVYPQVSADWLISGKGDMFVSDIVITSNDDIEALKAQITAQMARILELNEALKKKNQQIDVLLTEKVNIYNNNK